MYTKRKEELDDFLKKPEIELIYIYHINPTSPDAALAQIVLEYKKFESNHAHNILLTKQNKMLLVLTVVLAIAALLQVAASFAQIISASHTNSESRHLGVDMRTTEKAGLKHQ